MSKWEYKSILVNRTGNQEDFSYSWTYTPWQMLGVGPSGQSPVPAGLEELGRDGWELTGVIPTDVWVEGTRTGHGSHGVRTISYTMLFKRPLAG